MSILASSKRDSRCNTLITSITEMEPGGPGGPGGPGAPSYPLPEPEVIKVIRKVSVSPTELLNNDLFTHYDGIDHTLDVGNNLVGQVIHCRRWGPWRTSRSRRSSQVLPDTITCMSRQYCLIHSITGKQSMNQRKYKHRLL